MEDWKRGRAQELAQEINSSDEWNIKALTELCHLAGMAVEWYEADGEQFEGVANEAARRLGVEIWKEE